MPHAYAATLQFCLLSPKFPGLKFSTLDRCLNLKSRTPNRSPEKHGRIKLNLKFLSSPGMIRDEGYTV